MADDELIQERLYTIPLRKLHKVTRTRRAPVAMRIIEDFIVRHMKPEREGEVLKTSKAQWKSTFQKALLRKSYF